MSAEFLQDGQKPSIFTEMLLGEIAAPIIFNSQRMGVAAVIDSRPVHPDLCDQVVVFPHRQVRKLHGHDRTMVGLAIDAISERIESEFGADLVVEHKEGRGVPDHAHVVLFGSYERGDSEQLYHRPKTVEVDPAILASAITKLTFSEGDVRAIEDDDDLQLHYTHVKYRRWTPNAEGV